MVLELTLKLYLLLVFHTALRNGATVVRNGRKIDGRGSSFKALGNAVRRLLTVVNLLYLLHILIKRFYLIQGVLVDVVTVNIDKILVAILSIYEGLVVSIDLILLILMLVLNAILLRQPVVRWWEGSIAILDARISNLQLDGIPTTELALSNRKHACKVLNCTVRMCQLRIRFRLLIDTVIEIIEAHLPLVQLLINWNFLSYQVCQSKIIWVIFLIITLDVILLLKNRRIILQESRAAKRRVAINL